MLSRFHLIPERNRQTDGRTDRFAISISRVSMLTRDKHVTCLHRYVFMVRGYLFVVHGCVFVVHGCMFVVH